MKKQTDFVREGQEEAFGVIEQGATLEEIDARADNAARTCVLHADEAARLRAFGRLEAYLQHIRHEHIRRGGTHIGRDLDIAERLTRAHNTVLALEESSPAPVVEKTCFTCGNRAMDMDMEPYCCAKEILGHFPWGKNLSRGRPDQCGPEAKLWTIDTRRRA